MSSLQGHAGRSGGPHAPASLPPGNLASPGPRGRAHSFPATGARLQAVSPLNESGCALVLCFLGQRVRPGPRLFSSQVSGLHPPPMHLLVHPSVCPSIYLPTDPLIVHPYMHPSV